MRTGPATPAEIRQAFDDLLNSGGTGLMNTENPLDWQTMDAIERVWRAGPEPPNRLVEIARLELAAQLDGTHEREDQAELLAGPLQGVVTS